MRVLVVYAHPVEESFIAACRRTVVETLRGGGHDVDLTDLYAEGFDPVLSREERLRYHTVGGNTAGVEAHIERLRQADAIALVFPTWWYGMPAILKGYFDRVWVPGIAFTIPPDGRVLKPGLGQVSRLSVVTSAGSPWWLVEFYMGQPCRRTIMRGMKPLCAPGAKGAWLCQYGMDTATPQARARFLAHVERHFRTY